MEESKTPLLDKLRDNPSRNMYEDTQLTALSDLEGTLKAHVVLARMAGCSIEIITEAIESGTA